MIDGAERSEQTMARTFCLECQTCEPRRFRTSLLGGAEEALPAIGAVWVQLLSHAHYAHGAGETARFEIVDMPGDDGE